MTCAYVLHLLDAAARAAVLAEARRLLAPRAVVAPRRRDGVVRRGRSCAARWALLARALPAPAAACARSIRAPTCDAPGFALTQRVRLPRHGYPSLVLGAKRGPPT